MNNAFILMAAVIALGMFYAVLPLVAHTYQRYRRRRRVRCPETKGFAKIHIDARRAALSSAFGRPRLIVKNCTLWPERKGCAERCLG